MGAQNMMKLLMCIVIIAYARADDKIDTFVDEQYFPAEVETEFVEEMTEVTKKPCPRWCTNAKRRKHFLDTGVVKKEKDFVDPLCTWKKCFKCPGWLDKCPDLKVVKKGPASCACRRRTANPTQRRMARSSSSWCGRSNRRPTMGHRPASSMVEQCTGTRDTTPFAHICGGITTAIHARRLNPACALPAATITGLHVDNTQSLLLLALSIKSLWLTA